MMNFISENKVNELSSKKDCYNMNYLALFCTIVSIQMSILIYRISFPKRKYHILHLHFTNTKFNGYEKETHDCCSASGSYVSGSLRGRQ
ncbi:hypothetical protein Bache_1687 [Bacteroides helcogenes P 36-108]|uniref:Uncharacterized protein n=1 Tax=Bacteroides helcogenes (strain ATCC 35417 / DSM 20613 / JCM 6297 / CCUG 15421 / P 36-108) TaxID=693979 RepID=E6SN18_BACT6|nr:hypothetical protein Bache_1687 [Bacteroides helcogenes P 36-108]